MTKPDSTAHEPHAWVRDLLASQPRPSIPPEVLARVDDAIRAEARSRTAAPQQPSSERRRRKPMFRLAVAASAAAAMVAIGFALGPLLVGSTLTSATALCPTLPDDDADFGPISHQTGTDYATGSVPQTASQLLASQPGCVAENGDPPVPLSLDALAGVPSETGLRGRELASAASVDPAQHACVVAVARDRPVLAVDRGFYDSKPAIIVVVSESPGRAEILIADCEPGGNATILRQEPWTY